MAERDEVTREIRRFVLSDLLPGEVDANVTDDLRLRSDGVLDSMAVLRLVAFVERRFDVEIAPHEAGVEQFDSIADIAALVERKRPKGK